MNPDSIVDPVNGMRRNFWTGTAVSVAAYCGALAVGFGIDFRLTLFCLLALQVTWTLFCIARVIQLRFGGAHKGDAEPVERGAYGFALGGSISSIALFTVMVVLTQVV
jgi:hypothetical protein